MKLDVKTADGVADCWFYRPEGKESAPGVIFFMDALGIRESMHQMAQHLASLGYAVLLPNVFYRVGPFEPFDPKTAFTDPKEKERLFKIIHTLNPVAVMKDVEAYLDALSKQPGVKPGKVGMIGYCMGGRLGFVSAANYPDRVGAVAAFHPGGLVTDAPDSPHTLANRIKAELYLGIADHDRGATPEMQETLKKALEAAGVRFQMELYVDKKHGFAVTDAGDVFDADAQAKHWAAADALFKSAL